eukprot:TRINITY_DN2120_c0_g1_i1.p1 TRINITY_DN2120_c0_g1~~TRINITY_DN2120_c0_g1_i1.p1  ORF type:complete len:128 (+),score=29.30 TRINITY_DN2120_c0_g1_i1:22-384(+)
MKKLKLNLDLKPALTHQQKITRLYRKMLRLSFANYGHTETHYDSIERIRNEFKNRKGLKVDKDLKLEINYVITTLKFFQPAENLTNPYFKGGTSYQRNTPVPEWLLSEDAYWRDFEDRDH